MASSSAGKTSSSILRWGLSAAVLVALVAAWILLPLKEWARRPAPSSRSTASTTPPTSRRLIPTSANCRAPPAGRSDHDRTRCRPLRDRCRLGRPQRHVARRRQGRARDPQRRPLRRAARVAGRRHPHQGAPRRHRHRLVGSGAEDRRPRRRSLLHQRIDFRTCWSRPVAAPASIRSTWRRPVSRTSRTASSSTPSCARAPRASTRSEP